MRNPFINQAFIFLICSVAVVLAAIYFFQSSGSELCRAARNCPEKIENIGGEMLWESLSNQFISAVHN